MSGGREAVGRQAEGRQAVRPRNTQASSVKHATEKTEAFKSKHGANKSWKDFQSLSGFLKCSEEFLEAPEVSIYLPSHPSRYHWNIPTLQERYSTGLGQAEDTTNR